MRKWYRKFKSGRENIADESCSGKLISVADKMLENKVELIIQCDLKARLSDIVYQVIHHKGTVQNIVTKKLKYRKICTHWIPHTLTAKQCTAHVTNCKKNLIRFRKVGNAFLNCIVTGDESWCHYYIPTNKQFSLIWKHKNLPQAVKTRSKTSAGKVTLMPFWRFSANIGRFVGMKAQQ